MEFTHNEVKGVNAWGSASVDKCNYVVTILQRNSRKVGMKRTSFNFQTFKKKAHISHIVSLTTSPNPTVQTSYYSHNTSDAPSNAVLHLRCCAYPWEGGA